MRDKRWAGLAGVAGLEPEAGLIEMIVSPEPADGQVIEFRSLRGLEDSVACLLGQAGLAEPGDGGCSLAA